MLTQQLNDKSIQILYCKSTDTKPNDCSNGSIILEIDTGKYYKFSESDTTWYEAPFAQFDGRV